MVRVYRHPLAIDAYRSARSPSLAGVRNSSNLASMRVAIWGSCATRDAFGVREHSFESIDYFARTSWIAQASAAPAIRLDTSALAGFAQRMVLEDVDRLVVERVIESKPDLVVIDFIDERIDLLDAGVGAWVTGSTYAGQTPTWAQLRAAGVPALGRYHPFREPLFRAAVDQLAPKLLTLPPHVPVLLNLAWYTPISSDESVPLPEGSAAKAVAANQQIARLATWVARALGDRCVYFQASEMTMRADPAHKWGFGMYHYERALYDDLIDAMEATAAGRCTSTLARTWQAVGCSTLAARMLAGCAPPKRRLTPPGWALARTQWPLMFGTAAVARLH